MNRFKKIAQIVIYGAALIMGPASLVVAYYNPDNPESFLTMILCWFVLIGWVVSWKPDSSSHDAYNRRIEQRKRN